MNEDYPDADPDDPDADELDSDDRPKQPQKKKSKTGDGWEGKDKITWWKKDAPRMPGRTCSSNVIKFRPGLNGPALNVNYPKELWGVSIIPEIIGLIVEHANLIVATKKVIMLSPAEQMTLMMLK